MERKKKRYYFQFRKDINEYFLEILRERIPYFLTFYRQKSQLDNICAISFGVGCSDCTYFVLLSDMLSDRKNVVFVYPGFSKNNSPIYSSIKEKEALVRERIGEKVVFKGN
ncbi:hypothetical protein [Ureibacillus thermosphaericus]|uniref:Uncharacterized protein n=1 Tax=Ureibacillus thermosphaericus TaxID=51173 RepID=A0A840PR81_URETH|nr:hypothetical protein [Ureibacillus thermosphaericus]MBB5148999.1 hypothetical protein [Ureibacillus thermosphaericus]NKZ31739.1 hypothetical protein [Ureibacillus thermosphaericus]